MPTPRFVVAEAPRFNPPMFAPKIIRPATGRCRSSGGSGHRSGIRRHNQPAKWAVGRGSTRRVRFTGHPSSPHDPMG